MQKLIATIIKDFRLLFRDWMGLAFMFVMPIVLVIVITNIENTTFNLVNENKVTMLLCNQDSGDVVK